MSTASAIATTASRSDIAIVGAGLIGSAIALWLARHTNYSISLIERNPVMLLPHQANQRVVALGVLATNFLDDIGVFSSLTSEYCNPYQKMFVWDENSDGELAFDAANVDQACLGHMVDSQMCTYQLQQAVLTSRVNCHFDVRASKLDLSRSGASLDTESGRFDAKLLIAADGSHSWGRHQAKIFANRKDYRQRG
ncbi:MAG: FAD-dependent monooxygenase, partial [Arenicella sp.]|nr:FAD-dependent monooxygenase [Arenicella sp.]